MPLFQKLYTYRTEQHIPIDIDTAWDFFSNPKNLKKITPTHLGFHITNAPLADEMYIGMLITYIVKPVLGIPMRWCTEITHIEHQKYFIDEQRFGPYSMRHHEHWFEEVDNGVIMRDKITYGIPLGIIGQLAHGLFVKSKVHEIFDYRHQVVEELFGELDQ